MESDEGKLFVGGIAWDTTEERLRDHFGRYGDVNHVVIMRDKTTGQPRGFGFVIFSDPSVLDSVLQDQHTIDGRTVEAKRALSREQQQNLRSTNPNSGRNFGGAGSHRTKKIFVGGLPSNLTEDEFGQYFRNYGNVTDVVIMFDQNTSRPRGFGFISFDSEDAVDNVLHKNFHELNGKLVEVKRALPKDANPGGGYRGGGYGSSGSNNSSFDSQMDSNRYLQSQSAGGGYPPYSGYGAPAYGYGMGNSAVGYGGYGVGGYGSANAGFGGPAGAYGNTGASSAGYASSSPGTMKNQWNSQTPGYGGSGYGGAPMGQSQSGAARHGNQGYGYNSYGGSEGSYNGGGAGEVAQQGAGGNYMGRTYGSNNSASGYSDAAWRSDS